MTGCSDTGCESKRMYIHLMEKIYNSKTNVHPHVFDNCTRSGFSVDDLRSLVCITESSRTIQSERKAAETRRYVLQPRR